MATHLKPNAQVIRYRSGEDRRTTTRQCVASPKPLRFEDFFASESHRLLRALCVITRDPNEAEEIEQEAFVRVLERWERVVAMDDPVGYLYRVAMNVLRSQHRRARLASRLIQPEMPRDEIDEVDERDAVTRMLSPLNPRQRAALVLTAAFDYSSEEAGDILGVKGSCVRVLTTRARAAVHRLGVRT